MVQGGACYNANANAADFHKASLNFHYPQFACMPGRVWKTQQTEWHQDVSSVPQPIFVRSELAKVCRICTMLCAVTYKLGKSTARTDAVSCRCVGFFAPKRTGGTGMCVVWSGLDLV